MNKGQKVHPGSIIRGVLHTVVQMTFSKSIFHPIPVYVTLVSNLYTYCDEYSEIIPHIFLHIIPTRCQFMVHILHMWYCQIYQK